MCPVARVPGRYFRTEERADVLPDNFPIRRYLDNPAAGAFVDHRIAVWQTLCIADVMTEKPKVFNAGNRVLPDFLQGRRVEFQHP